MTLEKLLIFGFGLAAVTALTFAAQSLTEDRKPQYDGYKSQVETTMDLME